MLAAMAVVGDGKMLAEGVWNTTGEARGGLTQIQTLHDGRWGVRCAGPTKAEGWRCGGGEVGKEGGGEGYESEGNRPNPNGWFDARDTFTTRGWEEEQAQGGDGGSAGKGNSDKQDGGKSGGRQGEESQTGRRGRKVTRRPAVYPARGGTPECRPQYVIRHFTVARFHEAQGHHHWEVEWVDTGRTTATLLLPRLQKPDFPGEFPTPIGRHGCTIEEWQWVEDDEQWMVRMAATGVRGRKGEEEGKPENGNGGRRGRVERRAAGKEDRCKKTGGW